MPIAAPVSLPTAIKPSNTRETPYRTIGLTRGDLNQRWGREGRIGWGSLPVCKCFCSNVLDRKSVTNGCRILPFAQPPSDD